MDGYNGGERHYRYNTQRRYIQHKQKKSPIALIVISIILLISTVVLSIVTDFFRCPSLDRKTCRGWLTYSAVR